jgi:hypothetical protein
MAADRSRVMPGKWKDKLPGGLADKRTPEDFEDDDVEKGADVEMEHTDDREVAREIAMDHLTEDEGYYSKLELIEGEHHAARKLASLFVGAKKEKRVEKGWVQFYDGDDKFDVETEEPNYVHVWRNGIDYGDGTIQYGGGRSDAWTSLTISPLYGSDLGHLKGAFDKIIHELNRHNLLLVRETKSKMHRPKRRRRARKLALAFRVAKKVEHEKALVDFLKGKDSPITDPQFHEFAEELGVDEHKLEAEVYEMLRQRLKG